MGDIADYYIEQMQDGKYDSEMNEYDDSDVDVRVQFSKVLRETKKARLIKTVCFGEWWVPKKLSKIKKKVFYIPKWLYEIKKCEAKNEKTT
jgi:hypothetical protein